MRSSYSYNRLRSALLLSPCSFLFRPIVEKKLDACLKRALLKLTKLDICGEMIGIDHTHASAHHPKLLGKVEACNKSIKHELLRQHYFLIAHILKRIQQDQNDDAYKRHFQDKIQLCPDEKANKGARRTKKTKIFNCSKCIESC